MSRIVWLRISGSPVRAFAKRVRNLDGLVDSAVARHGLLIDTSAIRNSAGSDGTEVANATARLDNRSGQCSSLFSVPPVGAVAEILSNSTVLLSGVVDSIDLDDEACQILVTA